MYLVKVDGCTIRMFKDPMKAKMWAKKYCHDGYTITGLVERDLPRANNFIFPNEDMPDLVYKPFMSVNA